MNRQFTFARGKRILPLPGRANILTPPPVLPPIHAQVANAARAVARNAVHLMSGAGPLRADKPTQDARLEICKGCELYLPNEERCSHSKCGCFVRIKTFLLAEKCPAAKW